MIRWGMLSGMIFYARFFALLTASFALAGINGCGGSSSSTTPPTPLTLSLGASTLIVPQDGTVAILTTTISPLNNSLTETISGLPTGITQIFPGSAVLGNIYLTGSSAAQPGKYTATVTVNEGTQTASQSLTLLSAPVAAVYPTVDNTLGLNGVLSQFMSTSFQPAEWDNAFFASGPAAKETLLTQLQPQHIRLQGVSQGVPMKSNTGAAADWDFTVLDSITQPVLASADHSPEFQVAIAPAWMLNSAGHLDIDNHLNDFAAYAANLVRYYNTGGFDWGGQHFQSPSPHPIHWWGVFNEYNLNGVSAAQYVKLYNAVVPAMAAVDPTIQFSALEFSDFGLGSGDEGDPMLYLPLFFAPAASGGVNAPVGIVSTHFYGSCNQSDPDATVFAQIPQFAANVQYFEQQTKTRPDLGNVPVWVTENNVNADFSDGKGMSTCNPGQVFVSDTRGTSAFFAAWRPYAFSQLGKAGNQAIYHWDYDADQQYGEVDYNSGNIYLSYWVDQALATLYPVTTPGAGPSILTLNATESSDIETLATRNADHSIVIMIVDRALHAASDNNGAGDPRTVIVDLSALSGYTTAQQLTFDTNTNIATGATLTTIPMAARIPITINGYGVAFVILH
jgi:hypothetical protein